MNPALKFVGAAVLVPLITLVIYLGAVIQVYVLAWVLEGLGRIV